VTGCDNIGGRGSKSAKNVALFERHQTESKRKGITCSFTQLFCRAKRRYWIISHYSLPASSRYGSFVTSPHSWPTAIRLRDAGTKQERINHGADVAEAQAYSSDRSTRICKKITQILYLKFFACCMSIRRAGECTKVHYFETQKLRKYGKGRGPHIFSSSRGHASSPCTPTPIFSTPPPFSVPGPPKS